MIFAIHWRHIAPLFFPGPVVHVRVCSNLTLHADRSSSASSQSEPEVLSGEDVTDESDDDSEDPQYVKEIHKFMKRAIKNGA